MKLKPKFFSQRRVRFFLRRQRIYLSAAAKAVNDMWKESRVVCVLFVTLAAAFLAGIWFFFSILSSFLGSLGALFLQILGFYLAIVVVARTMVLPGSFIVYRRMTEEAYRKDLVPHYAQSVATLGRLLASKDKVVISSQMVREFLQPLEFFQNLEFQVQNYSLKVSPEQQEMYDVLKTLFRNLAEIQVDFSGRTIPLTEGFRNCLEISIENLTLSVEPQSFSQMEEAQICCKKLTQMLSPPENDKQFPLSAVEKIRVTLCGACEKPSHLIGSLDFLRANLQLCYGGQQIWVPSGKEFLDCCYFRGEGMGPVVLMCGPNAGFYETFEYRKNFYLMNGASAVFLWNYRGFGRSFRSNTSLWLSKLFGVWGSSPNQILEKDAEIVAQFVIDNIAEGRPLGLHGRSIGGVAACHIASVFPPHQIEFLVCDRTFGKLCETARQMMGEWARNALQASRTVADPIAAFKKIPTKVNKILICDPEDSVIEEMASLKTFVALDVLESWDVIGGQLKFGTEFLNRVCDSFELLLAVKSAFDGDDVYDEENDTFTW